MVAFGMTEPVIPAVAAYVHTHVPHRIVILTFNTVRPVYSCCSVCDIEESCFPDSFSVATIQQDRFVPMDHKELLIPIGININYVE